MDGGLIYGYIWIYIYGYIWIYNRVAMTSAIQCSIPGW